MNRLIPTERHTEDELHKKRPTNEVKIRCDMRMYYFLSGSFATSILLGFYNGNWWIVVGVGSIAIFATLQKYVNGISQNLGAPINSRGSIISIYDDVMEEQLMLSKSAVQKESITTPSLAVNNTENYLQNAGEEVIKEEINFREMFQEITNNLSYVTVKTSMVEVNVNIRNEAPFVSNKRSVGIVLNNLISNVISYQDPLVPKPFVYIKVHSFEAGTSIVIRDNGIGLKGEMHNQIFDMFFRSSHTKEAPGLGLHLVKETIEKLNGRIQVQSEFEGTTEFNIHIPNYYRKERLA